MDKSPKTSYETLTFRPSKEHKTLLADIAVLAKKVNRTLNNYIETVLLEHRTEKSREVRDDKGLIYRNHSETE